MALVLVPDELGRRGRGRWGSLVLIAEGDCRQVEAGGDGDGESGGDGDGQAGQRGRDGDGQTRQRGWNGDGQAGEGGRNGEGGNVEGGGQREREGQREVSLGLGHVLVVDGHGGRLVGSQSGEQNKRVASHGVVQGELLVWWWIRDG